MAMDIYSFVKVSAPIGESFHYFFSLNLMETFQVSPFFPYTVYGSFKDQSAKKGIEHLICFEGGSTAKYLLRDYIPETSFTVNISNFTSKSFTALYSVDCYLSFSEIELGRTKVHCHYKINLHSNFWNILFNFFLRKVIQKKMDLVMIRTAKEVGDFVGRKSSLDNTRD